MCLIRRAEEQDIAAIHDLWMEINDYHAQAQPHIFRQGQSVPREQIQAWLDSADNTFFVAVSGGQTVGFVYCIKKQSPKISLFVPRTYMVIDVLVVRSDYRRQGIGKRLMARAHEWAHEQGIDQVEIGVWEFNAGARKLYESLGYTTFSRKMWVQLPPSQGN